MPWNHSACRSSTWLTPPVSTRDDITNDVFGMTVIESLVCAGTLMESKDEKINCLGIWVNTGKQKKYVFVWMDSPLKDINIFKNDWRNCQFHLKIIETGPDIQAGIVQSYRNAWASTSGFPCVTVCFRCLLTCFEVNNKSYWGEENIHIWCITCFSFMPTAC